MLLLMHTLHSMRTRGNVLVWRLEDDTEGASHHAFLGQARISGGLDPVL